MGLCVDLGGSVAGSAVVSANRGQLRASLSPPRLGSTSRPPMGTHKTPLPCTISTPWAQTSTCRLSGLSARSSRTMTRKHRPLLPPPCSAAVALVPTGLLACMCPDFPPAKPGLNNTRLLESALSENSHRRWDGGGGQCKDMVSPLLPLRR